jgi:hypothetical protein
MLRNWVVKKGVAENIFADIIKKQSCGHGTKMQTYYPDKGMFEYRCT